jgi:hypothetical protein
MSTIVRFLAGLGLLTLGRKLFWLFIAVIGFEFGFSLAERFFQRRGASDDLIVLGIALVFGIAAALLGIILQQIAIYVGGFLAGGSFLVNVLGLYSGRGVPIENLFLLGAFIVGGIIGVILVTLIFDWALIILSSLVGAEMVAGVVVGSFGVGGGGIAFIVLFIAGVLIQASMLKKE